MSISGEPGQNPPAADALRRLPAVDQLLKLPAVSQLLDEFPRAELLRCVRQAVAARREALLRGQAPRLDNAALALDVRERLLQRSRASLRRVINATGIVLHTGLGRAPLAPEAVEAVAEIAGGYCNLELDLASGRRGDRHAHAREALCELTGAEDALVVNNNAAGTYLALHALARDHGVVVSRGQLVEIGGSYRMPEIMAAAGCRMIEVGTTNRTRLSDYEQALDADTRVLLRVHTSNYRICGFAQSVPLSALVELARRRRGLGLRVIDDLGSGLLEPAWIDGARGDSATSSAGAQRQDHPTPADERSPARTAALSNEAAGDSREAVDEYAGVPIRPDAWDEPTVRDSVAAGADLTLFSGDKLLGGPQAGVIVGARAAVERLRNDPLARALRPDKLTLAALEATLRLYRDPDALWRRLPVAHMLSEPATEIERRAGQLAGALRACEPRGGAAIASAAARERRPANESAVGGLGTMDVCVAPDESFAGGGAAPTLALPTWTVRLRVAGVGAATLAASLRRRDLPVICRIKDEALIFDCRTIAAGEVELIAAAVGEALREVVE